MDQHESKPATWEEPQVILVGDVAEVIQGGGGKLSTAAADSGDTFKPVGQQ